MKRKAPSGDGGERMLQYKELASYGVIWSRSYLDRLEKAGRFPRRISVGSWHVAWLEREVINHQRTLVAQRSHKLGEIGSAGKIKGRRKRPPEPPPAHPRVDLKDRRHDQRRLGDDC